MRYFIFSLVFIGFLFNTNAQAPVINWSHSINDGTPDPTSVTSTATDANGNIYVAGYFYGSVDMDFGVGQAFITSQGQYDGFVAKYNSFGEFIWVRRFSGTGGQQVNNIHIQGGYIHVTGFFEYTMTVHVPNGPFQLPSNGAADAFWTILNSDGYSIKNYQIGGSGNENGLHLNSDQSGNVYLSGTFGSANVDFDVQATTVALNSSGALDGFIAKYDGNQAIQWVQRVGGGAVDDAIFSSDVDNLGNVYVVGQYRSTVGFGNSSIYLANSGNSDGFIAKLNSSGTFLWAKKIGGNGSEAINNIKLNGKGAAYISGNFSNTCNLNPNGTVQNFTSLGGTDMFITKIDTNQATALWIRPMGGTGADLIYGLALDTAENIYSTGSFSSSAEFPIGTSSSALTGISSTDVFVSKINSSGAYVWSKGIGQNIGYCIEVSKNGNTLKIGGSVGGHGFISKLGKCNELNGSIIGLTRLCNTQQQTYSIAAVSGATSYTWTIPSGWTGTSTTDSITVTPNASSGTISVVANTSCGAGYAKSIAINYGNLPVDSNLARLWIANPSGSDADIKNGYNLSLNQVVKDTDRFGTPDASYRLTNISSYIGTGNNLPTGNTTISFWYYYVKNGTTNNVLIGSNSTTLPAGHPLLVTVNSQEKLYPWSSSGVAIGSGISITPNTWYHIVLARNQSTFVLYVNGVNRASGNNLALSNFDRIGNNYPGISQGATGKFDDIRIYSTILSDSVVQYLYQAGSIKSINLSQPTCINKSATFSMQFSNTNASLQWSKNTVNTVTTPNFLTTINSVDTLVKINVTEPGCISQSFETKFIARAKDSVNVSITADCSYHFGNDTLIRSGIYNKTFINQYGCDSVVRLTLTINYTNAVNLSASLIRNWTFQATDSLTDIVSNNLISAAPLSVLTADRHNNPSSAIYMPDTNLGTFTFPTALPSSNYTIAFWFKPDSKPIEQRVLLYANVFQKRSLLLYLVDNNLYCAGFNGSASGTSNSPIVINQWNHIVFTLSSTGLGKVYVNGNLVLTNPNMLVSGVFNIGGTTDVISRSPAVGAFDDIKVYSQILSDAQIALLPNLPSVLTPNPKTINACEGSQISASIRVTASNQNLFETYKNTTKVNSDSAVVISNTLPTDTTLGFRVYNGCAYENYVTRLNISPPEITINETNCVGYTYNGKTYTSGGTYKDTIYSISGCTTVVNLNLTINPQLAVKLDSGLTKYWALNSGDKRMDLATGEDSAYTLSGGNYATGRTGKANTAYAITANSQVITPAVAFPVNNDVSVSFWYQYTYPYSGARTLLSNAQANGNIAKYLYVNTSNQLFCGTNTSNSGVSANTTFVSGTWYHIVYQMSSTGNVKVFVNGVQKVTINSVPVYPITRIGNRPDGLETGAGNYDDIKVYNRLLTLAEIDALSKDGSMLAMPTVTQACVGSTERISFNYSKDSLTTVYIYKGNTFITSDTGFTINSISTSDTLFTFEVTRNCFKQTFKHRIAVHQTNAAPTIAYNSTTKHITATSTFNKYVLYRNNVAIDSSTTTGNINYQTTACGNYQAKFYLTGVNCPSTSNIIEVKKDTTSVSSSICQGSSIVFNGNTITSAGTYYATFNGTQNCDSIVKLTVSIKQASSSTINRIGCGSIVINSKTYTQSGQYKDTLVNSVGCDSIITLNLTINAGNPSVRTFTVTACNQYVLNNKTYTQTGTFRDTLYGASATGCDSILVLNLTLNKNGSTLNMIACKSYVFGGKTLTQSGVYYDTLTNVALCDSIVTLNLLVNTINTTVTKNGNTLTASETGATYQWFNCGTNQPIAGANSQSYTATASGNYKVIIGKNNCVDTSACESVSIITCTTKLSYTILGADSITCKDVRVVASNAALPMTLNISWTSNPNGNTIVVNDSVHNYIDVCPGTYKVKVTDNNNCVDSIEFAISNTVGIYDKEKESMFSIYPNPTKEIVNIEFVNNLPAKVTITDIQGRTLKQFITNSASHALDVSNLNTGIYLLYVEQNQKIAIEKLIIK